MQFRPVTDDDLPEIAEWFAHYGKANNIKSISNYGILCYDAETNLAGYWLYPTMSAICFTENMVGNPHVSARKRLAACDALFDEAQRQAKAMGYRVFVTSVSKALGRRLERKDFKATGNFNVAKAL